MKEFAERKESSYFDDPPFTRISVRLGRLTFWLISSVFIVSFKDDLIVSSNEKKVTLMPASQERLVWDVFDVITMVYVLF